MLKITLQNFKCWQNLKLNIKIGEITLIKGPSGIGKSSIFQAIYWCLYDNMKSVAPNNLEKSNTSVSIEMPYTLNGNEGILYINRQRNPKKLLLSHNNKEQEDKVAQSIIDTIFGNVDLWSSSCYISQGCRNSFLTSPNTGKMELLNSISFNQEDPSKYIDMIEKNLEEFKIMYNNKLNDYNKNVEILEKNLKDFDLTKKLTEEQIANFQLKLQIAKEENLKLNDIKYKRDIDVAILNNLQKQLVEIVEINIPKADQYIIDNCKKYGLIKLLDSNIEYENNISYITNILYELKSRDELFAKVKKLEPYIKNVCADNQHYTIDDYQIALSVEKQYLTNKSLANALGIEYYNDDIEKTIEKYKNILSSQTKLKLENELNNLSANIKLLEDDIYKNRIPLEFPKIIEVEIQQPNYSQFSTSKYTDELNELSKEQGVLITHIKHLEKGQDVIKCPSCDVSLRYKNGGLNLAEIDPVNKEETINNIEMLNGINNNILQTKKKIQDLISAENKCRSDYEYNILMEKNRIDNLREHNKQIEFKEQNRQTSIKIKAQQILDIKIKYQKILEEYNLLPNLNIKPQGNTKILSASEIENMHILIAKLSNIEIILLPKYSSNIIKEYLDIQLYNSEYEKALEQYNNFKNTIPTLFREEEFNNLKYIIDKIKEHWNIVRTLTEEKIRLDKLKQSLLEQIDTYKLKISYNPEEDLKICNENINNYKNLLETDKICEDILSFHNKVFLERTEVLSLNQELNDLETLKQYAKETECIILDQVVNSINTSIENICNTLFDKSINIKLGLFKTLKSTKNIKSVVNFNISYQGGDFDNISHLSGGEGDRASLALTLALKKLSSCPLLLLDESLSALDLDMKEATIQTIRENINDTIIIIMHDGIEGIYDNVINVSDFK